MGSQDHLQNDSQDYSQSYHRNPFHGPTDTEDHSHREVQRPPNLKVTESGPSQGIPLMPYKSDRSYNPYSPGNAYKNETSDDFQQDDSSFKGHGRSKSVRSLFSHHSEKSTKAKDLNNPYVVTENPQIIEEYNLLEKIHEDAEEDDESEYLADISEVVSDLRKEKLVPKDENSTSKQRRRGYYQKLNQTEPNRRRVDIRREDGKIVKSLRNVYTKILSRTLLTRAFVYWLPLALILFIPLAVGAWGNRDATIRHTRILWLFIWLEVVWGSLWVGRVFSHYLPVIVSIILGILNPSWRKYTSVFVAMEMPITYIIWTFVSFITFMPILSANHKALKDAEGTQPWQYTLIKILVSFFLSSLVYAAERLLIHFISVSFHKTRFATRIRENKQSIRVLALLLDAAYLLFPRNCPEFFEEDRTLSAGGFLIQGSSKRPTFVQHVTSNPNVQTIAGKVNRVVGGAASAIGNVARDISGNSSPHSSSGYDTVLTGLSKKSLAEVLANRIWKSLVLEDSEELRLEDLKEVLGSSSDADAERLFTILDKDGNGGITLDEMVVSVQEISHEQKTIYRSLRDMDSAIGKLHQVLFFVVILIMIIIFIGFLAPSVSSVLATLGTSLLALSFVFSATAQEILASCIFLFVKHPLDIGDMVAITLPTGTPTNMICVELSLLYTVFRDISTGVLRQTSNAVLNTIWIDNLSRAGPMSAGFGLVLGTPETSYEDIEEFRERLNQFIAKNIREFCPGPYVQVIGMPDLDRVELFINVTYRNNFADTTSLGLRRTKFLKFLSECIHDIPLHVPRREETYSNPAVPMYSAPLPTKVVESNLSQVKSASKRSQHHGRLPIGMDTPANLKELDVCEDESAVVENDGITIEGTEREAAYVHNRSSSIASRVTSMSRTRSTKGLRRR